MNHRLFKTLIKCAGSLILVGLLGACSSGSGGGRDSSKPFDPNGSSSTSSSSSSSSGGSVDLLVQGREHYEAMCQGCHGADGRGGTSIGLTVDDRSLLNLTNFIANNMPRGNASNCVATCAEAAATYVKSLFEVVAVSSISIQSKVTMAGAVFEVTGEALIAIADESNNLSSTTVTYDQQTLYVFDNDTLGESNCNSAACVNAWPPLLAENNVTATHPFTLITRVDGHKQWALQDQPLYTYVQDENADDILGQGVGGIWHLAMVTPVAIESDAGLGDYLTASRPVYVLTNTEESLVDKTNFSLYTFANDSAGTSNCTGGCLDNWPALMLDSGTTVNLPYSLVARDDSLRSQLALKGQPLYFFVNDTQSGDTLGSDVGNWNIARPLPFFSATDVGGEAAVVGSGYVKYSTLEDGNEINVWANLHGRVLYTRTNDADGESGCEGACLENWWPVLAHEGALAWGNYTLIERVSGSFQWALNGKAVYFFAGDTEQYTATGESAAWPVARP